MKLLGTIAEGEILPRGYGLCWWDWRTNRATIAPIGLNVLLSAARWGWHWLRFGASRWLAKHGPSANKDPVQSKRSFFRGFVLGVFAAPVYLTLALFVTGVIP